VSVNLAERWFVSAVAFREVPGAGHEVRQALNVYDGCTSEAAAVGEAFLWLERTYPQPEGWWYGIAARRAPEFDVSTDLGESESTVGG
jgi:hypothetical protein